MRDYLISLGWFYGTIATLLFLIGVLIAYSAAAIFIFAFLGMFFFLPALLIGVLITFWRGMQEARCVVSWKAKGMLALSSPALLAVTICLTLPLLWAGLNVGTYSRLLLNYRSYETIILEARRNPNLDWYEQRRGIHFSVDRGPPVRVAFNPEGFLNNWRGIIFDPTGDVMQADSFDPVTGVFRAPERITKLFGGDLESCRHLIGDYYSCGFT